MTLFYGFLISSILAVAHGYTKFESCGAVKGVPRQGPIEVKIHGCTDLPCVLKIDSTVTAEMTFAVPKDTETLRPVITLPPLKRPFILKDACDTLTNTQCPLKAGQVVTQEVTTTVLKSWPVLPGQLITGQLALHDDDGKEFVCVRIRFIIKA